MPFSKLVRAHNWISPGVLLRIADLVGLPLTSRTEGTPALQCVRTTITVGGRVWPYVVWSPPGHAATALPVILFLHGAGERGQDGHGPATVGLAPALCRFPERYPAHVVMPQCPVGHHWSGPAEEAALRALEEAIAATAADEDRIYLTGVSMGAQGALRLAARDPSRFAALVPVCGWGDTKEVARRLKNLPLWFFHGAADPIVPARCSAELVAALTAAGACNVRHTEYPGIGHECWDIAYAEPQLPEWLFAQSRSRTACGFQQTSYAAPRGR